MHLQCLLTTGRQKNEDAFPLELYGRVSLPRWDPWVSFKHCAYRDTFKRRGSTSPEAVSSKEGDFTGNSTYFGKIFGHGLIRCSHAGLPTFSHTGLSNSSCEKPHNNEYRFVQDLRAINDIINDISYITM